MPAAPGDQQVPRPQEVFISYSRKDEAFAQRLAEALTEQKREVWLDRKDIEFTADWKQRVLRGIEDANVFVCVVSPDYAASAVCREEAGHAVAHNKRLVPLLRRPVDFSALHPAIAAINALPFAESDDFDAGVGKLLAALDTDFDWLDQHTHLLRRALDWDGKARDKSLNLRGNDLRTAEQWLTKAGSARERNPTQLQTEYILTSRRASNRRLRMFLGIAVAVGVITIVLAAVATIQSGVARKESARAEQRTREVSQSLSRSDFLEATRRLDANEIGAAIAHLARALRVDPENGIAQRRLISLLSQRDWQFPALDPLVQSDFVRSADISPDGKRIVTSCGVGIVQLWDAERGERIGEMLRCPSATVAFNRDGSKIAVTGERDAGETSVRGSWQVLDRATGKPLAGAAERPGSIAAAAFTGDNKQLLVGLLLANGAGEVWASDAVSGAPPQKLVSWPAAAPEAFDAAGTRVIALEREPNTSAEDGPTIARVWNLHTSKPMTLPFKHDEEIQSAIFSPDGDRIATQTRSRVFVWDLAADRLAFSTQPAPDDRMLSRIAYSPDAKLLVAVNVEHPARETDWAAQIHDAKTGEPIGTGDIRDHGRFRSAEFSPDSQFLLLCSSGQRARVWCARPHDELEVEEAVAPLEHADVVTVAKMTPDGRRIITGSFDKTLRIWEATPGLGRALPDTFPSAQPIRFAEMSPRGKRIATVSAEPAGLQAWDAATRQPLSQFLPLPEMPTGARFSGDERLVIAGGEDGIGRVWDASSGRLVTQLAHPSRKAIETASLNFDGTRAVTANSSETLLWDVATNRAIPLAVAPSQQSTPGAEFTPDGARLLTISGGEMNLWDASTGARVWGSIAHPGKSTEARFSPDGKRFAVFGVDAAIDLFDSATGKLEHSLPHRGVGADAVFSADGRLVATCSFLMQTSGYVQVWDAATGVAVTQPLVGEEDELHHVSLSPDGILVSATERSGRVHVWSIATGRECVDPLPHHTSAFPAWFSSDGKRLLTVSGGTAQFHELWDLGRPSAPWLPDLAEAVGGFALNNNGVATALPRRTHALEQVRTTIAAASGDDLHVKWARWFFADRRTRSISPFSHQTMREELAHKP